MTTPAEIFANAVDSRIATIHTSQIGIILAYDPATNKARIQPALNKQYNTQSTPIPLPILEDVPVIFPWGSNFSVSFPIEVGDYCLLIFVERSIDLWKSVGGQVTPNDPRKYDLSDAVAIPGLFPFNQTPSVPNSGSFTINFAGSQIRIDPNGDILIKTSNKVAIGTPTAEVLDILSRVINILATSVTTPIATSIQQTPLPPNGDTYLILQTLINSIKATLT